MIAAIQTSLDSIERKRREMEAVLSGLSPGELSFSQGPQRWSILMTLEHIVISEEGIAEEMEKALEDQSLTQEAKSPSAIRMVLFAMDKDVPVDVPAKELEPSGNLSLGELLDRWKAARRRMHKTLNAIGPDAAAMPILRHPFGGPMDAGETIEFLIAHLDNHVRQIHRILKANAPEG